MSVYFIGASQKSNRSVGLENRIRETVHNLKRINSLSDIAGELRSTIGKPVYVLLEAPTNDSKYIDGLIDLATRHRNSVFFILISDDFSANDYKRLVRTGGADCVSVAGAPQEILDIIDRGRAAIGVIKAAENIKPTVIAFIPSAGGVGNTKLALEVGVRLKTAKKAKDRRICLIDLDFQSSHACTYLDIEPRLRIEEIAKDPERLDAHLFEIFTSHHSSGLDVIAAPRSKVDFSDVTIAALDALFEAASKYYDLILIDLPVTWFPWTFEIITNSDALVVTGINTIPCLHQIAETLTAIRSSRKDSVPISVVINRCESRLIGGIARQQHVQRVIGQEQVFFVQNNPGALVESINAGTPIVTSGIARKISKQIEALANYCGDLKSLR